MSTIVAFCLASIILAMNAAAISVQPETDSFPLTKIIPGLPQSILEELPSIINYRFGTIAESNMMTTEVHGYVLSGKRYRFAPGKLEEDEKAPLPKEIKNFSPPKFFEFQGEWLSIDSKARPEANVLGGFGTLLVDHDVLEIPLIPANAESLAYYNGIIVRSGEGSVIQSPKSMPVTVVRFEKNYEKGYLSLPDHGGGYYLETHDLPHFWSHLSEDGAGAIILAKQVRTDVYHITAFCIPYGAGIYVPGGVIHCDALLIGDVMPIYSVTPDFSTVHVKNRSRNITQFRLVP